MPLVRCRPLRGPNVWSARPVIELRPDPSGPADLSGVAAASARFQTDVGSPAAVVHSEPSVAAVEFADEALGLAAVDLAARSLVGPVDLPAELAKLRDLEYRARFPVSTAVVVRAARNRGIPVARLSPEYSRYVRLGQGSQQHRCRASEPDTVSGVARMAAADKHLAKHLLRLAGVPVPEGRLVSSEAEAWAAAEELGLPVAVKPQDADLGLGVSLDVRTRERVEAAFRAAKEHSDEVLVERFAPGIEHRVLVTGDRVPVVTRVDPPQVLGDGTSTVADLVARVNADPLRTPDGPRYPLILDAEADAALSAQGFSRESVPPAGAKVLVRRDPPYFKAGGNFTDETDRIHPANVAHALAAARAVGLPVAGLDVVAVDIGVPLEDQQGVVVEINPSPGLWLHLAPWNATPRPVGEAIVDATFPPGADGRIPVVAVVGDSAGVFGRVLAQRLEAVGKRVGVVGPNGVVLGGRRWVPAAANPQERAEALFANPAVDVAVVETSAAELESDGFAADRCTVAVVLGGDPIPEAALRHAGAEVRRFAAATEAAEVVAARLR